LWEIVGGDHEEGEDRLFLGKGGLLEGRPSVQVGEMRGEGSEKIIYQKGKKSNSSGRKDESRCLGSVGYRKKRLWEEQYISGEGSRKGCAPSQRGGNVQSGKKRAVEGDLGGEGKKDLIKIKKREGGKT